MFKKTITAVLIASSALWTAPRQYDLSILQKYKALIGTMDKARSSFEKGDLAASEKHLDRCLRSVPDHHEAHYFKAQIRYRQGDFAKGLEHMETAENGYVNFATALRNAQVSQMMKNAEKEETLSELIPALEKALEESICKPPTYMAAITDAEAKLAQAKNEKPDALRKDKSAMPAEYLYFRGNCLYRLKRFEEAEALYRDALAADPAHANAANNLINLLYGQKRYAEASAAIEQAEIQKVQVQAALKTAVLDAAKK